MATALIRAIGDGAGALTRDVEAELNNIIAWAKDARRCIKRDNSSVGNVNAGPDVLHTFSLPADTLHTNGDYLWVCYSGTFAANANNKVILIKFGGQTVSNLAQVQNGGQWLYDIVYARESDTTVRCASGIFWGRLRRPSGGALTDDGLFTGENTQITVSSLTSNAMTMEVQAGDGASVTDDTKQNLSVIELCQQ